jgi:hypothetical protein
MGDQISLRGYSLSSAEVVSGEILQLTLFWRAVGPIEERYKVFTHVVDPYGHLVGQRDAEPGGGAKITSLWEAGEVVTDHYGVPILSATPPGQYHIHVGMYGLENGVRLPVAQAGQADSDHVTLQTIRVTRASAPPPIAALGMEEALNARLGEVTLVGYDLSRLGHEHEPLSPVRAGDILHLTLFWTAGTQPSSDVLIALRLEDLEGTPWLERQSMPTEGMYPSSEWRAGEIVRDQHNLHLANLPSGTYHLYLSVRDQHSGADLGVRTLLTSLQIE